MLSCAGTFLPSAFCCALSHRGLGSRIPAGIPTGPGQLLMTQVPFLELPAALPGSLLGGWCCCAGNGQSSPGLETWSCPDPTGSSGISPSTGLAWEQFSLQSWPSQGNLLQQTGGTGTVPEDTGVWGGDKPCHHFTVGCCCHGPSIQESLPPPPPPTVPAQLLQQDRNHLIPVFHPLWRSANTSG